HMGVVSFDDNDLFRLNSPSITVASQPIQEIAFEAIELLLELVESTDLITETKGRVLKPIFIERESTPKK
ncbi:MAG: hypothetical protein RL131_285, partial [Bacteroidota bacterium]